MSCDPNDIGLYSYSKFTFVESLNLCKIESLLHMGRLSWLNILKDYSPA